MDDIPYPEQHVRWRCFGYQCYHPVRYRYQDGLYLLCDQCHPSGNFIVHHRPLFRNQDCLCHLPGVFLPEYRADPTSPEQETAVGEYLDYVKKKTERERIAETKTVTGVFSGSYGVNPLTGERVPIWISEYVLAGYGTGAIMAVPAHDSRDYVFAKTFNLPIVPIIEGCDVSEESFDAKEGKMVNSGFMDGMEVKEAIPAAIDYVEKHGLGHRKVNYRLRDAIFSRQRYWGEPFPIYFKDGIPTPVPFEDLPLTLPEIDEFKPTEKGEPPLARAKNWTYKGYPLETSTMPGFAGSSAYYLRYMDPHNGEALVDKEVDAY